MFKKLLLSPLFIFLLSAVTFSQTYTPITVSNVLTGNRFNLGAGGCGAASGQPIVTARLKQGGPAPTSGTGISVVGGVLTCSDYCDTTVLEIKIENIRFNQQPGTEWIHGLFFPANSGFQIFGVQLPSGWSTFSNCTGAPCSAQINGGPGFYFDGTTAASCCSNTINDGIPSNNWGVGTYTCSNVLEVTFNMLVCNKLFVSGSNTFRLRGTSDGGTGCWSTPDPNTNNTIDFTLTTSACPVLYNPPPANGPITRNCGGTPSYSTTLTAGCGNSNTVTWWTASVGGTMVGTGSPFTYTTATCPSGTTLYAECCNPSLSNTCANRRAYGIGGTCPTALALNPPTVTQPTCSNPTGSATITPVTGTSSGTVTYTITPGGTSNTTGIFAGLPPGGYTVSAVDANNCPATTGFTLTTPTTGGPGPAVVSPVNYCQFAPASPLSATGANVLYYTTATGGTGVSTYTPSTSVIGTFTFYASQNPTLACESARTPIIVNVNANSTVTLTSAAGTDNQTVCVNSPITQITYATTAGITGATVSGLPANVTGVYSGGTNGTITINGTPSATGTFPYTITTTGGCGAPTASGTITVSTLATLTLSSAPATTTQAVCVNTPINAITYNVGGGATGATVTPALPAGVSGVFAAGVFTISGSPTTTVGSPFPYTVSTTGGCGVVTLSGTITVNPNQTITLTSAAGTSAQTVCVNAAITPIVYTTANGATGATVTPALPAGVTGVYSGGTNGTYTISGTPSVTTGSPFSYTVTTTGGCASASLSGSITVNPNVTITLTSPAGSNNQTVNINTPVAGITYGTTNGVTGITVTGLPAGVTGIYSGGTNGTFTISGSPTVAGTFNYTVTTSGGCTVQTQNGTIIVNNLAGITLTSPAATAAQTICIGTLLTNIVYITSGGATGASITAGVLPAGVTAAYSGGTNGTYTISGTPTASGAFSYTVSTTGGIGSASLSGTITVNPNATLVLTSPAPTAAQTLCINMPLTNIVYTTGSGATGASNTGLPAGVTGNYSGGTNGTYTISGTPSVAGPFTYTVTTTGGCSSAQLTGTITVNPNTTIALTSAAGTNTPTVCINTPILTSIVYTTANGATGASATGLPAGVTGTYSGGTNGTYTISGTPSAAGPFNYTVTTLGGCTTPSVTGTITVNPNSTIALTSAAGTNLQAVCINSQITQIVYTTANGATGVSATGLPTGVTGVYSGGTNGTYTINGTPNTTAGSPFNYTITTTGGCSAASLAGTITVNPAATIALTSPAATAAQTVCINTGITSIVYTTANGATGASATGLPAGVTDTYSGGTNGTYTISGIPSASGPFSYTVTTSGGCGNAPLQGTITVTPNVTLTLSSAAGTNNQTGCINTAITGITYTTTNGVTGVTLTTGAWPAGVTGSFSGTTYTISGTPTVAGSYPYTITTSGGCSTASQSGTITVNPAVTIALTSAPATTTQNICVSTILTAITYSTANGVTGATVSGLPAGVTGVYSGGTNGNVTISGTPTVAGTYSYTVLTSGGCGTASLGGTITVRPNATIALTSGTASPSVCVNGAITNIVYTTANGATGASITGLPTGMTGAYSGGTNGTFTISGSTSTAGAYNYTITTTGGCSTASLSGTITVNANVTLTLTSASATTTQAVCVSNAITSITYSTANGVTGATVTGLPAGVTGVYSGGTNGTVTISGTPTISASTPFAYTVTTTGGCSTATQSGSITVNPAATITLTSGSTTTAQTLCVNTAIAPITYSTANGVTGVSASGLPAGVTGAYSGGTNGTYTISGTPGAAGTNNIIITTTGGCGVATLNATITVNPNVTLVLGSAAGTDAQTVCINTALTNITYTAGNGTTGATITSGALPAGVSGAFAGGVFTISGTPTVAGAFSYTVTTNGGCTSASQSGTMTINPAVTMTLSSAAATAAQTLCVNTAISNITYTTANGATGAGATGLPAGVTGTYNAGVFTISGTPTAAGTSNYTVTTTGGCATATLSGSLDVIAIPLAPTVTSPVNYCPGDAAVPLTATGTNLLWYTSATGGTGSPVAPTPSTTTPGSVTYYVSQTTTAASCEGPRAAIVVNVNNSLSINIGSDTTICQGDTVRFHPVVMPDAASYTWRSITANVPNSTISSINTKETTVNPVDTGMYVLRATLGGCSAEDTVKVNVRWKPNVEAGTNTSICFDRSNGVDSVFLSATISHTSGPITTYSWTPTDSLSTPNAPQTWAYPTVSTWYTLTASTTLTDYGCVFNSFDSVKVIVQPTVRAFAGNDTIGVQNVAHQLHGTGGTRYLWSSPTAVISNPAIQNPTTVLSNDANFYLRVEDVIGCFDLDSVFIKVYEGPTYYVPNAFSPNGDGLNDVFRVVPVGITTTTYFRVFNRYGQLVFETSQWMKGWDGTWKGKPAEPGAYVWMVKGKNRNNLPIEMKGTVMLIR